MNENKILCKWVGRNAVDAQKEEIAKETCCTRSADQKVDYARGQCGTCCK